MSLFIGAHMREPLCIPRQPAFSLNFGDLTIEYPWSSTPRSDNHCLPNVWASDHDSGGRWNSASSQGLTAELTLEMPRRRLRGTRTLPRRILAYTTSRRAKGPSDTWPPRRHRTVLGKESFGAYLQRDGRYLDRGVTIIIIIHFKFEKHDAIAIGACA